MIKKLRLKFVAVCMLLVTAVLAAVFISVYTSSQHSIRQASRDVLERVISEDSAISKSDGRQPSAPPEIGGGHVQLPYFTVEVWNVGSVQSVFVTGGTYSNLEDSDALKEILSECLTQTGDSGTISDYHLRYLRRDNGFFLRIAFVDMSVEQETLKNLMASYLQIGLAALVLLLGVSCLLAYWVTKPVETAWARQRQFLSDASHELKTPLTVILSNAELLEAAQLPERPARWVDNIGSESQRMKTLVEEMLTLARADNMVRTSVYTEVNLSDVATDCALSFEPVAFEAGKPLSYEITDGLTVIGDAEKLRQVISVLLDNAIKYGRDKRPVSLTLRRNERHACLQISNECDPIPQEQLNRLFERFYRADASRGEKSGFGLGLPIASTIASEHRATLRAESDAASTRFLFTIPLKK